MGLIPKKLKRAAALVFLVVINVVAAGYDVYTSAALRQSTVHPTVYAFLRALGASVILAGVGYWKERGRPAGERTLVPAKEDVGLLIGVGVLAVSGQINMAAIALGEVPASLVGMFAPLAPAFSLTIAFAIGMEVFRRRELSSWLKAAGAAVTLLGGVTIAAVATTGDSDMKRLSRNLPLGIAFLFVAKVCGATYPIMQKLVLARYRSHVVAAWMYIYGTASLAVGVIPLSTNAAYWHFNVEAGLALLYSIVLGSALNYTLIAFVNKRLTPVILTASYPLESIFAPLFAYIFLGQTISLADGVGGGIIIVGLLITVYAKFREAAAADAEEAEAEALTGEAGVAAYDEGAVLGPSEPGVLKLDSIGEGAALATPRRGGAGIAAVSADISGFQHGAEGGAAASAASSPSATPGLGSARGRRKTRAPSRIFLEGPLEEDVPVTALWVGPSRARAGSSAALRRVTSAHAGGSHTRGAGSVGAGFAVGSLGSSAGQGYMATGVWTGARASSPRRASSCGEPSTSVAAPSDSGGFWHGSSSRGETDADAAAGVQRPNRARLGSEDATKPLSADFHELPGGGAAP